MIDFYNLTIGELLEQNSATKLVVNEFIFLPYTRISELKESELKVLFGEGTLDDIIKKYHCETLGAIRFDVKQRLGWYVQNRGCVMYINAVNVMLWTRDSLQYIERTNFDRTIKAIIEGEI